MVSTVAPLPEPCGPISAALLDLLPLAPEAREADAGLTRLRRVADEALPEADGLAGDDLHLALYVAYELHYTSFEGADPGWEWAPGLLAVRSAAERVFLDSLRHQVGPPPEVEPDEVGAALFALAAGDDAPQLSRYIDRRATLEQVREFVIHRSAYQLK